MATEKTRAKRNAQRLRKRQEQAELEETKVREEEDLENADLPLENVPQTQIIEKDYDEGPMAVMAPGPTSWEQEEAEEVARKQAQEMREVTYKTENLVWNILYSQMPSDQKAGAIKRVGEGLGKRLKAVDGKVKKSNDMDLLELKAMIAQDARHTSMIEKATDFLVMKYKKPTGVFPHLENKAQIRYSLKAIVDAIEKGGEDAIYRESIPAVKLNAIEKGIGAVDDSHGALIVKKGLDGTWRALMIPTNNFIDTDEDILSEAAHLEYVDWVNKNMDLAPIFMCHHIPGTARKSRVDYVGYENGFLFMSAPLEEDEAAGLLRAQELTDLGMSHQAFALRDPHDERVVVKYRMFEVSDLPLDHAANPFTDLATIKKEVAMKTLDPKTYLATIVGEADAEKFIARAELKQKDLQKAGVESKEKTTAAPAAEAAPATTVVNTPLANVPDLQALVKAVSEELGMEQLSEVVEQLSLEAQKVPILEGLLKELKAPADEKLAALIDAPASKTLSWMNKRASQSDATKIDEKNEEDKKLVKSVPTPHWLNEATGTTPVVQ